MQLLEKYTKNNSQKRLSQIAVKGNKIGYRDATHHYTLNTYVWRKIKMNYAKLIAL